MTKESTLNILRYNGDGASTVFATPPFDAAADLVVTLRAADGAESVLALTTHYTLTGVGEATGGTCTLTTAPAGESSPGAGDAEVLAIKLDPPITQKVDYQENDPFPAATHEAALDKLTMICQSLDERLSRAVLVPLTSSEAPPSPEELLAAATVAEAARDAAEAARDMARAWADAAPGTAVADGAFSARHHADAASGFADAAAQSAAAAAAVAGLPVIGAADAGKVVGVNATADGFELLDFLADAYKAPAPVLTGALTVLEGAAIALAIADHEDGDVYEITDNPLGLEPAGTAITGTAPGVAADASYTFALRRVRPDAGLLYSDATAVSILVQNVPIADDPEGVAWANDAEDWPEADRTGVSVGTGQMDVAGAALVEFGVDAASTVASLVLTHAQGGMLAEGDVLVLGDGTLFEVPGGVSETEEGGIATVMHNDFDSLSDLTSTANLGGGSPDLVDGGVYICGDGVTGGGVSIANYLVMAADTPFTWIVSFKSAQSDSGNCTFGLYQILDDETSLRFQTWGADIIIGGVDQTVHGFNLVADTIYALRFEYHGDGTFDLYDDDTGALIHAGFETEPVTTYQLSVGGLPAGNVTMCDWLVTTGQVLHKYTIPCSPALDSVPSEARRLPALSLASGAAEEAFTAPGDFAALAPASVSRSGDEFTVTCAPVALGDAVRRIAVGLAGDGWSAYSDGEDQDAAQGDWTRATVSVVLGADFFKTAAAATLMED
jgi:hypothetical protein